MNPGFVRAVEMLPAPPLTGLPEERCDGLACVWCGGPPAIALGPRLSVTRDALHRWAPRACHWCTTRTAARTYQAHIHGCAHCTPMLYCPDARALHALAHRPSAEAKEHATAGLGAR